MKFHSKSFLTVGLLLTGTANAADLVPTQFKALETDLARSELRLDTPYSYRLGLNFAEGQRYLLHPNAAKTEDSSSIRRELSFSLMLPYRIETGIALYDSQQATSKETLEHKKQKLGGAVYARYHLVQSEGLHSSIVVQFEPGTADRQSFHQASQDKTGIMFAIDGTPSDYFQMGAYIGLTKRRDEKFRASRINDEVLYGTRFSAGIDSLKAFADMGIRSLPWRTLARGETMHTGRHYEIGLQAAYKDLVLQASKYVPTEEKFVGEPERGFKISLNYVIGKSRTESKETQETSPEPIEKQGEEKSEKAPSEPTSEADKAATTSVDSFDAMKSDVKDESLGAIPIFKDELPKSSTEIKSSDVLSAPGSDEFEKWEKTQAAEKARSETASEKAEREYREQLAKEKLDAEKAAKDAKSGELSDKERLLKEIEVEEKKAQESAGDIEKELNQYTLPGADEVNWNGLGDR